MATYYLCPFASFLQLFTDVGIPLSGALLWTYQAGTSTPTSTWTDSSGVTPNANPIQLNSAGRLPNVSIWQQGGVPIKVVFSTNAGTSGAPVFGNQIGPTFDNVSGINDFALANSLLGSPASGSGADLVANAMRSYDVFATARAANVPNLQAGQTLVVSFEGGTSIADGLGGLFYWNATSTASDDGINIIKPTSLSGAGRYLRVTPQQIEFVATKSIATLRATNTSASADPDLQITLPTGGTYIIEGYINDAGGTSGGGLKATLAYSGSVSVGEWGMVGAGTAVTNAPLTAIGTVATLQTAQTGVGSMRVDGTLLCTNGGVLSFNWAQNSSNGTASQVSAGSYLRVTRLNSATGGFTPVTHTFSTAGSYTETIPVGATTLTAETWGAGGGGGAGAGNIGSPDGGGGGGSGGYCRTVINVANGNGQTINGFIGAAGAAQTAGGNSTISSGTFSLTTMTANGGSPGGNASVGTPGTGSPGGTASGGNAANTSGNAGTNGTTSAIGTGGAGITGINGTGNGGGSGGLISGQIGNAGGVGKAIFTYS